MIPRLAKWLIVPWLVACSNASTMPLAPQNLNSCRPIVNLSPRHPHYAEQFAALEMIKNNQFESVAERWENNQTHFQPVEINLLAFAKLAEGDYITSITLLDQSLIIAPNRSDTYRLKAQALIDSQRNEDALALLNAAAAKLPLDGGIEFDLARLNYQQGHWQKAAYHAERAAQFRFNPSDQAELNLLRLYIAWAGNSPENAASFIQQLSVDDASSGNLLMLHHLVAQQNWSAANQLLSKIDSTDPRLELISIRIMLKTGEFEASYQKLEQYLAQNPDDFSALELKLDLEISLGAEEKILSVAEQIINNFPKNALGYAGSAIAYILGEDTLKARTFYNLTAAFEQQHVLVEVLSIWFSIYDNQWETAQRKLNNYKHYLGEDRIYFILSALLQTIVDANPVAAQTLNFSEVTTEELNLAYFKNLINFYQKKYSAINAPAPDLPWEFTYLQAMTLIQQNSLDEALDTISNYANYQRSAEFLELIGDIYWIKKNNNRALSHYSRALTLTDNNIRLINKLSLLAVANQDYDLALNWLGIALSNAEGTQRAQVLEHLYMASKLANNAEDTLKWRNELLDNQYGLDNLRPAVLPIIGLRLLFRGQLPQTPPKLDILCY